MPHEVVHVEHHCKLATILSEARKKHKSFAVCWLDLANAYGSVHHSLIQFSVEHYHAPPCFCQILQALYSDLVGKVITNEWETLPIPLDIGVYQGDPLSVVIFNTVINTLVDTFQSRIDLGYTLSSSTRQINLLQYADDTCLLADSAATCQHLLEIVKQWLQWSGMRAKVCKCHCMALQGSTGKLIDPQLQLAGETIPFIANNSIKFLGMRIQVPHDATATKETLTANLKRMLQAVDKCPLTSRQKLRLYKAGVCPRLSWLLLIEELPITWVERELEATATRFLKKWAGLAKCANTALLYLPTKRGGLNLPALTSLYKRLQVSRQSQLLMSPDGSVRLLAERNLQHELSMMRKKFKPAVTVRNVMVEDPSRSRKALSAAAKRKVQEEDDTERLAQLRKLEKQGQMVTSVDGDEAKAWANTIQSLPSQLMRFTLNAAMDTLPHNANLHLWGKKESDVCPLCGERQTLIHVLNCCRIARELRRYNQRHDGVLGILADMIKEKLPLSTHFSAA